jgi:3-deoxy-D-manno-octulosonic-acid transferase
MGPHSENFAEACAMLRDAGALTDVSDANNLADWVDRMLTDPVARSAAGQAGGQAAQRWAGLPEASAHALLALMRLV